MRTFFLLVLLLSVAAASQAKKLSTVAAKADIIAVIQVDETDYQRGHGIPMSGEATARVLVAYKGATRGEVLTIRAKGLGAEQCYYPGRENEGPRFLAFLHEVAPRKHSFDPRIVSGVKPNCALPIFVTANAAYALRYPIDDFAIPKSLVHDMTFADPYSYVDKNELTQAQIAAIISRYAAEDTGEHLHYTRGVKLADIRGLMFPGGDR